MSFQATTNQIAMLLTPTSGHVYDLQKLTEAGALLTVTLQNFQLPPMTGNNLLDSPAGQVIMIAGGLVLLQAIFSTGAKVLKTFGDYFPAWYRARVAAADARVESRRAETKQLNASTEQLTAAMAMLNERNSRVLSLEERWDIQAGRLDETRDMVAQVKAAMIDLKEEHQHQLTELRLKMDTLRRDAVQQAEEVIHLKGEVKTERDRADQELKRRLAAEKTIEDLTEQLRTVTEDRDRLRALASPPAGNTIIEPPAEPPPDDVG